MWNILPREPIIIVGAGMSGLVAAYELSKAGYNVQILEMSQRFGGRVKTLDQKDGFDRGLHTDGEISIIFYAWISSGICEVYNIMPHQSHS